MSTGRDDSPAFDGLGRARFLPAQHHTRSPTPSTGQPFCHRTSVRSGSRADSAWSPAAAGETPRLEAASFHTGRGKKYGIKKGWQSCPFFLRKIEVTSRGRNGTGRYPAAGSARRLRFLLPALQDRPKGPLLECDAFQSWVQCFGLLSAPFPLTATRQSAPSQSCLVLKAICLVSPPRRGVTFCCGGCTM